MNSSSKSNFDLKKLLNDQSFINWAKESNQNDISFWNKWLKDNPQYIDEIYTAKAMILGVTFKREPVNEIELNESLDKALSRISNNKFKQSAKRYTLFKYVASIAAVILIAFFLNNEFNGNSKTVVHETAFGEIMNLKLPDGTLVTLNGNSEISYNKENPRNVTLSGEAYFKVKPILSKTVKFWVNTEDVIVEVYGTQFNVNSRGDKTDVVLDEGSINLVLKNGDKKIMKPGEIVSFSHKINEVYHEQVSNKTEYSSWKENAYVFNNKTVESVMKHIEYTYGLPSKFNDEKLKLKKISGGIPNENIDICLKALEKAAGIKIIKDNNLLLIYKQNN